MYQAAVLLTVGYNYIGAQANINVWCPNVESTEDYTTAQIWLKGGPGENFESVESGWMVCKITKTCSTKQLYCKQYSIFMFLSNLTTISIFR